MALAKRRGGTEEEQRISLFFHWGRNNNTEMILRVCRIKDVEKQNTSNTIHYETRAIKRADYYNILIFFGMI